MSVMMMSPLMALLLALDDDVHAGDDVDDLGDEGAEQDGYVEQAEPRHSNAQCGLMDEEFDDAHNAAEMMVMMHR